MEAIQITQVSTSELVKLISDGIAKQLQSQPQLQNQSQSSTEELLTRKETCELLKIDSSTLWAWTKKGKVKSYGIANRRYYKRSELMESLIIVKH